MTPENTFNMPRPPQYQYDKEQWFFPPNFPEEKITEWVDLVLKEQTGVFPQEFRRLSSSEMLLSVAWKKGSETRAKISQSLDRLARKINWKQISNQEVDYITNLFAATGFLRVESLRDLVLKLAQDEDLKPIIVKDGVTLHRLVLACLGALPCDDQATRIYERDIHTLEYTGICFRMLWKYNPEYAKKYAGLIRGMVDQYPDFPAQSLLAEAREKTGLI